MPSQKIDVTDTWNFAKKLRSRNLHFESTVTVDNGRRDRQEVVFWNEKTLHFVMFYSCKKSTFWVDRDAFSTVHSQHDSQQDRQELVS